MCGVGVELSDQRWAYNDESKECLKRSFTLMPMTVAPEKLGGEVTAPPTVRLTW